MCCGVRTARPLEPGRWRPSPCRRPAGPFVGRSTSTFRPRTCGRWLCGARWARPRRNWPPHRTRCRFAVSSSAWNPLRAERRRVGVGAWLAVAGEGGGVADQVGLHPGCAEFRSQASSFSISQARSAGALAIRSASPRRGELPFGG